MNEYPVAYAAYNKDTEIRMVSTSGGLFTVFANYFIDKLQAVIYGATFDESFNVVHIRITDKCEIARLRGSKYPQSRIGDTYRKTKKDLISGKIVLFVGTPCQVNGLKSFLGCVYDNLYCLDFVCHGVASDSLWQEYISYVRGPKAVKNVFFKYKLKGWKKWYFRVEFEDGSVKQRRGGLTSFMSSYLNYVNVRPSCYECRFKGLKHNSDFTLSDCWGVGEQDPTINDDLGLSAVLLQNERAMSIFNNICDKIRYKAFNASILMEGNWTAYKSVPRPSERNAFFEAFYAHSGIEALNEFFAPTLKDWLRYYYNRARGLEK